jgi:hypothetical protein
MLTLVLLSACAKGRLCSARSHSQHPVCVTEARLVALPPSSCLVCATSYAALPL